MRIVLDTNVLVSALLKRDGIPARILRAVSDGNLQLLLSAPLQGNRPS
jgi:predicted nucleic acid-binding protein